MPITLPWCHWTAHNQPLFSWANSATLGSKTSLFFLLQFHYILDFHSRVRKASTWQRNKISPFLSFQSLTKLLFIFICTDYKFSITNYCHMHLLILFSKFLELVMIFTFERRKLNSDKLHEMPKHTQPLNLGSTRFQIQVSWFQILIAFFYISGWGTFL